jgi:lantibiotic modifying enzyme
VPWQPLLQGAWKDRAWESVQAITADLSRPGHDPAGSPSMAEGAAGLAVLHAYLAESRHGHDHAAVAAHCLRRATAAVAENPTEASLHGGLTGMGWAIAHVRDRLPNFDGEEDLVEIDEALLDHLGQSPWAENYDLISGLVGFGVYALERLPRPAAVACLERVLDRLAETAEHRPEGITWWTDPAWLPAETRAKVPHGYYNLGLAHGVPGVIALLGRVCAAGVALGRARPLLAGAVRWLLAQQGPCGFAYWVGPGGAEKPTRLAWCYGDPGIAAALLGAARGVDEPAWERAALAAARRAAHRPPEQAGVVDAGLCHGAAGLGHLFNRLFQATGEPWLEEAASSWFQRALAMRRPGRGVGAYEAWQLGEGGGPTWVADRGLLTGAAGIALALLAATAPFEPAWDRTLLLAIPPSAGPGSNPDCAPARVGTLTHQES